MRREAFQIVAAVLLAALLPACAGQGGYGFGGAGLNTPIDRIVLTNGSGQANVFFVAPPPPLGGGIPPGGAFVDRNGLATTPVPVVQVTAVGVRGSQSVVVPNAVFTWTATLNTDGAQTYYSNQGGIQKPCFPATAATGQTSLPDVSPFSSTPVIWIQSPGGGYAPLTPQAQTSTVFISPAPETLVTFATGRTNYCIALTAVGNGVQATTEIAVTSSP
jgi:hypothetical protein